MKRADHPKGPRVVSVDETGDHPVVTLTDGPAWGPAAADPLHGDSIHADVAWDRARQEMHAGVLRHLESLRVRYEGGEKRALALALEVCAEHIIPMPPWAAKPVAQGVRALTNAWVEPAKRGPKRVSPSWDWLFGAPVEGRYPEKHDRAVKLDAILRRVAELRGRPFVWEDNDLTERAKRKRDPEQISEAPAWHEIGEIVEEEFGVSWSRWRQEVSGYFKD